MAVRAGRLKHRVTVQTQTTTQNAYGEAERAWVDLATVWAEVSPISGRELWLAAQTQATTTHRVTMRYISGLTESCRIQFGTRLLAVDGVINPEEAGEKLVLMCTEGASDDGG